MRSAHSHRLRPSVRRTPALILLLGTTLSCASGQDASRGGIAAGPGPTERYTGKSYALVVGVDAYRAPWTPLKNAVADARAVSRALATLGFDVVALYDEAATRESIIDALETQIHTRLQQGDRLLVFLAGHGTQHDYGDNNIYGFFVPYDGTVKRSSYVSMEALQTTSAKLDRARHQLFIIDACFGGLLGKRGSEATADGMPRRHAPSFVRRSARTKVRQVITAGGADQVVADGGGSGHSVFTDALLGALERGAGDDGDGYLTATELFVWLRKATRDTSQTPEIYQWPRHEEGDFFFELPGARRELSSAATAAKASPDPTLATTTVAPRLAFQLGTGSAGGLLYDAASDRYLVAYSESGAISVMSADGADAKPGWIGGGSDSAVLDQPGSMAIVHDVLYVADRSKVRMFDAKSGADKGAVGLPRLTVLVDLIAGADGTIYALSSRHRTYPPGPNAVWTIERGRVRLFATLDDDVKPARMAIDGTMVLVADYEGEFYQVDADGNTSKATNISSQNLRGVVRAGELLIVSSGRDRALFAGTPGRPLERILSDLVCPGPIAFDSKRSRVLVASCSGWVESYDLLRLLLGNGARRSP